MTNQIRWGILSTGRITHSFARDFAHVSNGRLQAVSSRSLESANTFADQYGIPDRHGSYREMLANDAVDAVYIATPHTLHHANALDAISAGKAVMCEKPLTINPAETLELITASRQEDVYLMEAMWTWFLPAIQKAREWMDQGRIGNLRHIKADFGYPLLPFDAGRREYNAELGGGCLLEMGIYPVALNWLFMQRDPASLQVRAHMAPNRVEDDVVWTLDYGNSVSSLATSFACRLSNAAYLIGDEGYILIPDFFRAYECHFYQLDTLVESFRDERPSIGFNFETEAVCNDLLQDRKESAVVTLADSLKFQQHMAQVKAFF